MLARVPPKGSIQGSRTNGPLNTPSTTMTSLGLSPQISLAFRSAQKSSVKRQVRKLCCPRHSSRCKAGGSLLEEHICSPIGANCPPCWPKLSDEPFASSERARAKEVTEHFISKIPNVVLGPLH